MPSLFGSCSGRIEPSTGERRYADTRITNALTVGHSRISISFNGKVIFTADTSVEESVWHWQMSVDKLSDWECARTCMCVRVSSSSTPNTKRGFTLWWPAGDNSGIIPDAKLCKTRDWWSIFLFLDGILKKTEAPSRIHPHYFAGHLPVKYDFDMKKHIKPCRRKSTEAKESFPEKPCM